MIRISRCVVLLASVFGCVAVSVAQDMDQSVIDYFERVLSLTPAILSGPRLEGVPMRAVADTQEDLRRLIHSLKHWNDFFRSRPSFENRIEPLANLMTQLDHVSSLVSILVNLGHAERFLPQHDVRKLYTTFPEIAGRIFADPRVFSSLIEVAKLYPQKTNNRWRQLGYLWASAKKWMLKQPQELSYEQRVLLNRMIDDLLAYAVVKPDEIFEASRRRKTFDLTVRDPETQVVERYTTPRLLRRMGELESPSHRQDLWLQWQKLGLNFLQSPYLEGIAKLRQLVQSLKIPPDRRPFLHYADFVAETSGEHLSDVVALLHHRLEETLSIAVEAKQAFKKQYPDRSFGTPDYYHVMQQEGDLNRFFPYERHHEIVRQSLLAMGLGDINELVGAEKLNYEYGWRKGKEANGFMDSLREAYQDPSGRVIPGIVTISGDLTEHGRSGAFEELRIRLHETGHACDYLFSRTRYALIGTGSAALAELHSQLLDSLTSQQDFLMRFGVTQDGQRITESTAQEALTKMQTADALHERFLIAIALTDLEIHIRTPQTYEEINAIWYTNARKAMLVDTVDPSVPEWISIKMHFVDAMARYWAYITTRIYANEIVAFLKERHGTLMHPEVGKVFKRMWGLGALYSATEFVAMLKRGTLFGCNSQ